MNSIRRILETIEALPLRRVALGIVCLTMLVRISLFFALHRHDVILQSEVENVAKALAHHGTFSDPYATPTGPTAHVAPAYPLILAGIYKVFGDSLQGEWAEQLLCALLVSIVFACLPAVSLRLLGNQTSGIFAGLLGALNVGAFFVETNGKESPAASAWFLATFWMTEICYRRFSYIRAFAVGVMWGVLFLFQVTFAIPFAVLLVLGAIAEQGAGRHSRTEYAKFAAAGLMGSCLALAPWMIRNALTFQSFFFLRDNVGIELDASYHDGATVEISAKNQWRHPFLSEEAARRLRGEGEIAYNRRLTREALTWIGSHPREFAVLVTERAAAFWLPFTSSRAVLLPYALITILGFLGVFALFRSYPQIAVLFAALWATFPLSYYLFQHSVRYRYPIEWTIYLAAGFAITCFCTKLAEPSRFSARPRQRSVSFEGSPATFAKTFAHTTVTNRDGAPALQSQLRPMPPPIQWLS